MENTKLCDVKAVLLGVPINSADKIFLFYVFPLTSCLPLWLQTVMFHRQELERLGNIGVITIPDGTDQLSCAA
jgi:hypothetical protein